MVDIHPKTCNLCGGDVIFTSNKQIYGKKYGNGTCYLCTECKAYVGTHKYRPQEALGILSNKEMRDMKMKCHRIFDKLWSHDIEGSRKAAYTWLAGELNIDVKDCHFGHFDMDMLDKAYDILTNKK